MEGPRVRKEPVGRLRMRGPSIERQYRADQRHGQVGRFQPQEVVRP